VTARKPSADDSFVLSALHQHLKEKLASATRETEYSRGQRELLLHLLAFVDGASDGRYPTPFEGGAQ